MIAEILKYVDLYGKKLNFYTDKQRKFYTYLGGIFTILSIIFYITLFIFISIDDFKRITPITTASSIPSLEYNKIKLEKEKIWIPWRIRDNNLKFINHTNILYPIINYYYYGENDPNSTENVQMKSLKLNYILCNETSMINKNNIYKINIPLNELYCIDMDDIFMEESVITNFTYYIKFDLYLCKNGISYDENNTNCTIVSQIKERTGINNSLSIEFYYPIIHFQPNNIKNPIIVIYKNNFYHLSKYSNKIVKIFLQKYVLKDDKNWLTKNFKKYSFWGFNSINEDSYFNTQSEDIIDEENSSRIFSFNIYFDPGIILYKRYYKKIFEIFIDVIPACNSLILFFKIISNLFKISDSSKKLTELLFENIQENKRKYMFTLDDDPNKKIRGSADIYNYQFRKSKIKIESRKMRSLQEPLRVKFHKDKIVFDNSFSAMMNKQNEINPNKVVDEYMSLNNIIKDNNKEYSKEKVKANIKYSNKDNNIRNFNTNKLIQKQNLKDHHLSNISNNKYRLSNHKNEQEYHSHKLIPSIKKRFIKKPLFPYRYYFFSLFIKNLKISKPNPHLFSKKYLNVYNFICQFFDITNYIVLLREFNLLKNALVDKKKLKIIESKNKINVNDASILNNIRSSNNQLHVFSRSAMTKNIHQKNRENT